MNILPEELPIDPTSNETNVWEDLDLPGSKSITNRALLITALSKGKTTLLKNAAICDDTLAMVDCLRKLGVNLEVIAEEEKIIVNGCNGEFPNREADLYVRDSDTTARFLTAALALKRDATYHLDGSPSMRKRPMLWLLNVLQKFGCSFQYEGVVGYLPFVMKTPKEFPKELIVDDSENFVENEHGETNCNNEIRSSQFLSALEILHHFLWTRHEVNISINIASELHTYREPFIEMTIQLVKFLDHNREEFTYRIEPDVTAASYFALLPFVKPDGYVELPGIRIGNKMLQHEQVFLQNIDSMGLCFVCYNDDDWEHPLVTVMPEESNWLTYQKCEKIIADFTSIADTFPTFAAITPLIYCKEISIWGIESTRTHECDRVSAVIKELSKIIGKENVKEEFKGKALFVGDREDECQTFQGSIVIHPCSKEDIIARADSYPDKMIPIETYNDHRMAMSFSILGMYDLRGDGSPWIKILNPSCVTKTFPNFYRELFRNNEYKIDPLQND